MLITSVQIGESSDHESNFRPLFRALANGNLQENEVMSRYEVGQGKKLIIGVSKG
jgi:hypothetical protein